MAEVERGYLKKLKNHVRYTGSPHHKRIPANYGFHPQANPRPNKSLCDGHRCVQRREATALFREAIDRGMISTYLMDGYPKYVWAVDSDERVFESKLERGQGRYHGYELGDDEVMMRKRVIEEWNKRCPTT